MYFSAFDGKSSLMEDRQNAGIAYFKGPWIYRMLEDALGTDAFNRALAEYCVGQRIRRLDWEDLAKSAQKYSPPGFDARQFLLPWLSGMRAPHLTAEGQGSTAIIHSEPGGFFLPVMIEAKINKGRERHRIWIRGTATPVTFSDKISELKIDPGRTVARPLGL